MKVNREVAPQITDFKRLELPSKETVNRGNEAEISIIPTGERAANKISVIWNFGSAACTNPSCAGLLPAMLMQGSQNLTASEITDRIDFMGAFVSYSAGMRHTRFETMSLNDFTPDLLELMRNVLNSPIFPEERFEALKRKTLVQYDLLHRRPRVVAQELLSDLIAGPDHPYYLSPKREDIEKITVEDICKIWKEGLRKSKINIFASGIISPSLYEEIVSFCDAVKASDVCEQCPPVAPFFPVEPGIRHVEMADAVQSSISCGFNIPGISRNHPDYILLRIAVTALGGYFGSRLMTNIREDKGLTYSISSLLLGAEEGTTINIKADCDPSYVERTLTEIRNEMEKMSSENMPYDEFRRLRSYYMTTLASVLESFKTVGDYYESFLTAALPPDYFEKQQDVLSSLTPESLRSCCEKYFKPETAITVVAGPR